MSKSLSSSRCLTLPAERSDSVMPGDGTADAQRIGLPMVVIGNESLATGFVPGAMMCGSWPRSVNLSARWAM